MKNKKTEAAWCLKHFKPVTVWQIKAYWFGLIPQEGHLAVKIVHLPSCDRSEDAGDWLSIDGVCTFDDESRANWWILHWCELYL